MCVLALGHHSKLYTKQELYTSFPIRPTLNISSVRSRCRSAHVSHLFSEVTAEDSIAVA